MKTVTAADAKNKWDQILISAIREPVMVQKNNRTVAVVVSIEEYMRLTKFEDICWALQALEAEKDGYLSSDKAINAFPEQ